MTNKVMAAVTFMSAAFLAYLAYASSFFGSNLTVGSAPFWTICAMFSAALFATTAGLILRRPSRSPVGG